MLIVLNADGTPDATYDDTALASVREQYPDRTILTYDGPAFPPLVSVNGVLTPAAIPEAAKTLVVGGQMAVTVVYKVDLYRRATEDEAEQIAGALAQAGSKMQLIFQAVSSFRSDSPEWEVLYDNAVSLFGADRAGELLAPSE